MPTPARITNPSAIFTTMIRPTLGAAVCFWFLHLASPVYGDGQPPKERNRQRAATANRTHEKPTTPGSAKASRKGSERGAASRDTASRDTASRDTASRDTASRDTIPTLDRLSSEQQSNVQQLQADLQVIAGGIQGAEDEIRTLAEDLQGMSLHSPDPAHVENLASDLAAAVADGSLSPREMAELATAVEEVLQSAGLSSTEVATLIHDVEAILQAAGVGQAEVQAVVHDLQVIVGSVQAPSNSSRVPSKDPSRRRGRGRS